MRHRALFVLLSFFKPSNIGWLTHIGELWYLKGIHPFRSVVLKGCSSVVKWKNSEKSVPSKDKLRRMFYTRSHLSTCFWWIWYLALISPTALFTSQPSEVLSHSVRENILPERLAFSFGNQLYTCKELSSCRSYYIMSKPSLVFTLSEND